MKKRACLATLFAWLLISASSQAQQFGSILGKVIDDTTSVPLAKADIVLEGTPLKGKSRGTSSDGSGHFVLHKILPGSYFLRVRFIGYAEVRYPVQLNAGDSVTIEIRLKRVLLQLPEVNITASRESYQEQSLQTLPSITQISASAIRRVTTVGEPDLFRALQTLPGITATSQASNQLYIRGGSPDQNLVRLDGASVYNPFHLFGLAANINPDIVGNVTVSTGGFPARYGDRLSGVVDVETRAMNESFVALGNISLLSSKLMLGGRPGSRMQWLVSGRRSYHDWAAKLFNQNLPYHFYDLFGKATFVANPRHFINLSIFYSADVLFHTDTTPYEVYELDAQNRLVDPPNKIGSVFLHEHLGFPWNNLAASLRWEHTMSPQWSSTVMANLSRTHSTGVEDNTYSFSPGLPPRYLDLYRYNEGIDWSVSNTLEDLTIAATILWQLTNAWQVQAGAEFSRVQFDYDWENFDADKGDIVVFFDGAPDSFDYRASYKRHGFFVEGLWLLSPRLHLQPSLRLDYRTTARAYTIDPRLSATFALKPNLNLQAAVGGYHQGISFLREGGLFGINELYFPLPFKSAAIHGIVGLVYKPKTDTELKIEAYYKNFYRQAVPLRPFRSITQVGIADGWAYGVEATTRRGNWQAFYVFSLVRRRFNGTTYDTPWDVRHRFQIAGQIYLGKSWDLDFQWELRTGQPYSPLHLEQGVPILQYDPRTGRWEYVYGEREVDYPKGAIRYPIYHRLDVTFSKRMTVGKRSMAPYLQIINIYNRRNPLVYEEEYVYRPNALGDPYERVLKPVGVPILPSFGLRFTF